MSRAYDVVCMSLPVSGDDWSEMDCWWGAFTGDRQLILAAEQVRRVDEAWKQRHWQSVDQFWDGFEAGRELLIADQFTQRFDRGAKSTAWEEIDSFWASYVEDHQSELAELRRLLGAVSDVWECSTSREK